MILKSKINFFRFFYQFFKKAYPSWSVLCSWSFIAFLVDLIITLIFFISTNMNQTKLIPIKTRLLFIPLTIPAMNCVERQGVQITLNVMLQTYYV